MNNITRMQVPEGRRVSHVAEIFGSYFPLQLDPFVYQITEQLSRDYNGGYWEFYALSNSGFYMAPSSSKMFRVVSENGYEGDLSADALGITACLYAYSHLSFSRNPEFAQTCAQQYHWLREYMVEHAEAGNVLRAID